jgi:hypothetical protein
MNIKERKMPDKLVCAFCGKEKKEIVFVIGASRKPDWCMVEGTGKMTCPDCYEKASKEGSEAIDRHIAFVNKGGAR